MTSPNFMVIGLQIRKLHRGGHNPPPLAVLDSKKPDLFRVKRALNKHNIKATFYTQTTLRNLLPKSKDPIPKEDWNNAVYQLNCKDCEAVYVGEIKRTLNIRAEEHITAIKSASKRSHTAEYCWKYNHDFDWEHKKVLDFEKNWKTRTIKETNLLRRKRA